MTSNQGDVVWAYGRAYTKDTSFKEIDEKWTSYLPGIDNHSTLKDLKAADDFTWLVKNSKLVWTYAEGFADGVDTADSVAAHAEGYNEGYKEGYADGFKDNTKPPAAEIYPADTTVWTWPSTYTVNWDTK